MKCLALASWDQTSNRPISPTQAILAMAGLVFNMLSLAVHVVPPTVKLRGYD